MVITAARGSAVQIASLLQSKGTFVATIAPERTVTEVLAQLAEHGVGALVVSADGQHIDGIISERDVVRALHERGVGVLDEPVSQVMTTEVHTCTPTDTVDGLMGMMTDRRIRHIPVVQDGRLAGIVSIGDLVKQRIAELERENSAIVEYIQTGR
jgi:CBS domain-containing protein